jgi:hypothetical protein
MIYEPPPDDQPDYWVMCARKCFSAARDFADLLGTYESQVAINESPVIVWTTYIVAWCGKVDPTIHPQIIYVLIFKVLYCHFFPKMDPDGALASEIIPVLWKSLCNMLSEHIYDRYAMAGQHANLLTINHRLFKQRRAEYQKAEGAAGNTTDTNTSGAELEEHIILGVEETHKPTGAYVYEMFLGEVPQAEFRSGSESDFESRRSKTTSLNASY